MAGSYLHVVDEDGALEEPEDIQGMLECVSGDVAECIEQMYGMIWYLANELSLAPAVYAGFSPDMPDDCIDEAQKKYKEGLLLSPTQRFGKERA